MATVSRDGSRAQRTSRKLPDKKVRSLADRGFTNQEIADLTGVNRSTVYRFLEKITPERQALESFKQDRADILARLQAKNLDFQEVIMDLLIKDGLSGALTPQQSIGLMFALNTQHGTLFDKERLERGQSTQNLSVLSKMLDSRVSNLYKPAINKGTGTSAPQEGALAVGGDVAEAVDVVQNHEAGGPGGTGGNLEINDATASSAAHCE